MPRTGAAAGGRYRMSNQGQPSARGLHGMHVLKDNAGCQVYRPTWNGTRTIFRPFPGRNPEDPTQWDPFRMSDEEGDWGDWIRRYDMAFSFGNPGITFILKDPLEKGIDDQQNPVWMLHRAINQAVKSGQGHQSWNPLIFGAAGRAAPLSQPKDGYVMQGILMEHKSQPQNPPRGCLMEHQPLVLLMSQSAGSAALEKLSEKTASGEYAYLDVTDLDGGSFLQFHQAGTQHNTGAAGPAAMQQMGQATAIGGSNERDAYRYEVEVLPHYNGIAPSYDGIHDVAAAHVKAWDDIIRIPTIEEQVHLLCGAGIPATAIVYALADVYQEFIPQHIFDQARAQQTTTTVPFQSVGPMGAEAPAANPMGAPAGNPMGVAPPPTQTGAPAQAPAGNPMGVAPPPTQTATQADPGMPQVPQTAAEPVEPVAVASTPATPAAAPQPMAAAPQPMAAAPQPMAAAPEAASFDPQPTHAEPSRSESTQAALQRARNRANAAQQGS